MESSEDRKRKLAAIRAAAGKEKSSEEQPSKVLKFRNYQPYDATLKEKTVESELKTTIPHVIEEDLSIDILKRELAKDVSEDLYVLPKKVNWDLKQQVEKDMVKLKRRTQKAIVEILREKLKATEETD